MNWFAITSRLCICSMLQEDHSHYSSWHCRWRSQASFFPFTAWLAIFFLILVQAYVMLATLGRCELSPPRTGIDSSFKMPARIISFTLGWISASKGRSRGAPRFGGSRRGTHFPFSNSRRVKIGRHSETASQSSFNYGYRQCVWSMNTYPESTT